MYQMQHQPIVLTISCIDKAGIVAAVSGFLHQNGCFIIESTQFGDPTTNQFFMRIVFRSDQGQDLATIRNNFVFIANNFTMHWQMSPLAQKTPILLMVSKQGHCLNDLLHYYTDPKQNSEIKAVISNHTDMEKMVKWHEIPFYHLPIKAETKTQQEQQILEIIKQMNIELIVLARYMQVLSADFTKLFPGKIINIHHSFLPGFKGAKPYHQAYDRGVKIIGATAHYVTEDLDEGPIIEQEVVRTTHADTPEDLLALGQDVESSVLRRAVKYHLERRVLLNGNKTVVFK